MAIGACRYRLTPVLISAIILTTKSHEKWTKRENRHCLRRLVLHNGRDIKI